MVHLRALAAFMDRRDLDAIAYPVSSTTASSGRLNGQDDSLGPFDCGPGAIAGLPALAIPSGFASYGLPVGLELLGRAFDEPTLIAIASGFEAHTDHRGLALLQLRHSTSHRKQTADTQVGRRRRNRSELVQRVCCGC